MKESRDGWSWLGVALVSCSWLWLRPAYQPWRLAEGIGVALLGLGVAALLAAGLRQRRLATSVFLALGLVAGSGVANEILARVEALVRPLAIPFTWLAYGVGRAAGQAVAIDGGLLQLQDGQGALSFSPTWGMVAFRSLVLFWLGGLLVLAMRSGRPSRADGLRLLGLPWLAFGLRYGDAVLRYAGTPNVLAGSSPPALALFWDPWTVLAAALLAALGLHLFDRRCGWRRVSSSAPQRLAGPILLALVAGLGLGGGLGWHDPGVAKRGRILIDDRLTGSWEPAGRLLDQDRYGDFSAYSFSAMVEHLSHRFAVWVNGHRRYTRDYLAGFDVLVLKTPELPLDPEEIGAIQDWVRHGGGLFAISDHTDLLGMSTKLNDLIETFGIEFAFDATAASHEGGFDTWRPQLLPEHPVSMGLSDFECMTPCSVRTSWRARPIMTLRQSVSSAGDYARNSNFGALAPNPADQQGLLVAAAAVTAGRGRVLAFGDSTVLSSFAYSMGSHAEFVARGVAWLNRSRSNWHWLGPLLAGLGVLAGIEAVRRLRHAPVLVAGIPLAVLAASGGWAGGFLATMRLSAAALQVPAPHAETVRVGYVVEGGHVALPAVLGAQPEVPPHANLMTFVQVPQRLGFETRVLNSRDRRELRDLEVLVLLNPDLEEGRTEPPGWVEAVLAWVRDGGRLIVVSRREHWDHDHNRAPLFLTGIPLEPADSPAPEIELAAGQFGAGRVVLMLGSEHLDVESMGHCMAYPGREQRRRYEAAYRAFGELAALAPLDRHTYSPN